jgi:predicted DNA-binding transcriptional regulator AlpA
LAKLNDTDIMEDLLTAKEIAQKLSIRSSTVYSWAHIGFIPHVRMGKCIRFEEARVVQWIQKRRVNGRARYKIDI